MTDLDQRLETIETKLAHSEDLVQRLNQALSDQQLQMTQLRAAIELIGERLSDALSGAGGDGNRDDERPPHY